MRISLLIPLLLALSSLLCAQEDDNLPVFGAVNFESDIATESQHVEVLSEEELDPTVRQFRGLVEKYKQNV